MLASIGPVTPSAWSPVRSEIFYFVRHDPAQGTWFRLQATDFETLTQRSLADSIMLPTDVHVTRDGRWLFYATSLDSIFRLAETGGRPDPLAGDAGSPFLLSPDASFLIYYHRRTPESLFRLETGTGVKREVGAGFPFALPVAFSPDLTEVAQLEPDVRQLSITSLGTGTRRPAWQTSMRASAGVHGVVWDNNGLQILYSEGEGYGRDTLFVRNLTTKGEHLVRTGDAASWRNKAWSSDGRLVANWIRVKCLEFDPAVSYVSTCWKSQMRLDLFDLALGTTRQIAIGTFPGSGSPPEGPHSLSFSPDASHFSYVADGKLYVKKTIP